MYDLGVTAKNPLILKLKNSKRANTNLFQVFTCVTIFGLVSSAPVDPFTAAAAATVGYLGQTAGGLPQEIT